MAKLLEINTCTLCYNHETLYRDEWIPLSDQETLKQLRVLKMYDYCKLLNKEIDLSLEIPIDCPLPDSPKKTPRGCSGCFDCDIREYYPTDEEEADNGENAGKGG